jgi:hypothetical protein
MAPAQLSKARGGGGAAQETGIDRCQHHLLVLPSLELDKYPFNPMACSHFLIQCDGIALKTGLSRPAFPLILAR